MFHAPILPAAAGARPANVRGNPRHPWQQITCTPGQVVASIKVAFRRGSAR
jgi:hypothetical protein